jgi:hypothetical protein
MIILRLLPIHVSTFFYCYSNPMCNGNFSPGTGKLAGSAPMKKPVTPAAPKTSVKRKLLFAEAVAAVAAAKAPAKKSSSFKDEALPAAPTQNTAAIVPAPVKREAEKQLKCTDGVDHDKKDKDKLICATLSCKADDCCNKNQRCDEYKCEGESCNVVSFTFFLCPCNAVCLTFIFSFCLFR